MCKMHIKQYKQNYNITKDSNNFTLNELQKDELNKLIHIKNESQSN